MRTLSCLLASALVLSACSSGLLNAVVTKDQIRELRKQVREGNAFDEAIKAAQEAFISEDLNGYALELYADLVNKGKAISEAKDAASKSIEKGKLGGSMIASTLYDALFKKGEWIEEATTLAKENAFSKDSEKRMTALNLYLSLVTKAQEFKAFDDAIKAVRAAINPKNSQDEKFTGLILLGPIIDKGQGLDEIAIALQSALKTETDGEMVREEQYALKKTKKIEDTKKKAAPATR